MKVDLTGKVAVVTGGGGILCSVMAEALAKSEEHLITDVTSLDMVYLMSEDKL